MMKSGRSGSEPASCALTACWQLLAKTLLRPAAQKWEIPVREKVRRSPFRGVWGYKDDRTNLVGVNTMVWTWDNIANWIDSL